MRRSYGVRVEDLRSLLGEHAWRVYQQLYMLGETTTPRYQFNDHLTHGASALWNRTRHAFTRLRKSGLVQGKSPLKLAHGLLDGDLLWVNRSVFESLISMRRNGRPTKNGCAFTHALREVEGGGHELLKLVRAASGDVSYRPVTINDLPARQKFSQKLLSSIPSKCVLHTLVVPPHSGPQNEPCSADKKFETSEGGIDIEAMLRHPITPRRPRPRNVSLTVSPPAAMKNSTPIDERGDRLVTAYMLMRKKYYPGKPYFPWHNRKWNAPLKSGKPSKHENLVRKAAQLMTDREIVPEAWCWFWFSTRAESNMSPQAPANIFGAKVINDNVRRNIYRKGVAGRLQQRVVYPPLAMDFVQRWYRMHSDICRSAHLIHTTTDLDEVIRRHFKRGREGAEDWERDSAREVAKQKRVLASKVGQGVFEW